MRHFGVFSLLSVVSSDVCYAMSASNCRVVLQSANVRNILFAIQNNLVQSEMELNFHVKMCVFFVNASGVIMCR